LQVKEIADKHGVTTSQIAIAWLIHKGVAAPIIGSTKLHHYDEAVKALEIELSEDDVKQLEQLYKPHTIVGALPMK